MFHTLKTLSFECLVTIFPFRSSHSMKSGYSSTNWLKTATPFICSLQLFYKSSSLILRHFIKLDEKRYLIETRSREEFWWFKNKDLMVSDPLWFRIIVLSVSKEKRFKTITNLHRLYDQQIPRRFTAKTKFPNRRSSMIFEFAVFNSFIRFCHASLWDLVNSSSRRIDIKAFFTF